MAFQEKLKENRREKQKPKNHQRKDGESRVGVKKPETIRKEMRRSMIDNLEARGLVEPIYTDMVEEYMELWDRRRILSEDVKERGVTVYDSRGRETENRSISLGIQVSKQMLSIYAALGFKDQAASAVAGGGEDDEL